MRELAGFYERAKLDNLLRHLLWNDDPRDAAIDDFEKMLEDSFGDVLWPAGGDFSKAQAGGRPPV